MKLNNDIYFLSTNGMKRCISKKVKNPAWRWWKFWMPKQVMIYDIETIGKLNKSKEVL